MAHPILEKQNDPEHIKLLRASTVAYSKAKKWEQKISTFLLLLSVSYPISYLFIMDSNIQLVLFGCSFLLTVIVQIFMGTIKGNTSMGAIFKEEYDTKIFNLPWKSTLKRPDRGEVLHFSRLYTGNEIKDWYSPNLSGSIDQNIAVAILQHTNTFWDIELRKKYRKWLIMYLIVYTMILSTVFVLLKVDALAIFMILFSLLPFFDYFISIIRGHSDTIEKREPISIHLDEIIQKKKHIGVGELRDIQDQIFLTRKESAKVPNFFFNWYKNQLNLETEEYIEEVNGIYKS